MIDVARTHFERASAFLANAKAATSAEEKARFLASAVENGMAIVESFLSQASDEKRVRQLAGERLPRYRLLKRVRVHQFHRRPLPAVPPRAWMQGPIQLEAGGETNSSARVVLTRVGLRSETTGGGKVLRNGGRGEKEICIVDGEWWDKFARDRISLEQAVEEFLAKVPDFLDAVRKL